MKRRIRSEEIGPRVRRSPKIGLREREVIINRSSNAPEMGANKLKKGVLV